MCDLKMRQPPIFILLILVSCRQGKVKVVWDEYAKGKPKTIYYFDNKEDATQYPIVDIKDGVGYANKPISFDEERYYNNGKLQSRGRYIKGQTCGLWQYFYETGVPEAKCFYLNGVTRDTVYCWYPSGKLKRLLVEVDTGKHQWHGFDYYENGNKSIESNLSQNSLDNWTVDGKWNEWFDNGKLKFQATIKFNWTVGKWQQWDSVGNFKEGEKPINITF
jgi:antitoxin component YwqK of YwqJK toxin-antitoxin module